MIFFLIWNKSDTTDAHDDLHCLGNHQPVHGGEAGVQQVGNGVARPGSLEEDSDQVQVHEIIARNHGGWRRWMTFHGLLGWSPQSCQTCLQPFPASETCSSGINEQIENCIRQIILPTTHVCFILFYKSEHGVIFTFCQSQEHQKETDDTGNSPQHA